MSGDQKNKGKGMTAGIIACVLAVLGILTMGFIFVPIAFLVVLVGSVISIKGARPFESP